MRTVAIPLWCLAGVAIAVLVSCFVFGVCLGVLLEQDRQLQRFFDQVQPASERPGWFPAPDQLEVQWPK